MGGKHRYKINSNLIISITIYGNAYKLFLDLFTFIKIERNISNLD